MRHNKSTKHGVKGILPHAIKLYNMLPDSLFTGSLKVFKINASNYLLQDYFQD